MSDGMGRELAYLSSHATNRYFIPNWGILCMILGYAMINDYRSYLENHWKARYSFRDFIKRERFYIYLLLAFIFISLTNLLYFLE